MATWLGSVPNVLQSGRVDSYLGAAASGVITASTFAANALGAVWDELTASHTTASTFGSLIGTDINATISSRFAAASYLETGDPYAYLTGNVGTHGAQLTALGDARLADLDAAVSSRSTFAAGGNVTLNDMTAAGEAKFFSLNSTQTFGTSVAGSVVYEIAHNASSGDPWATLVPGAYGVGTAGYILGTNLDTTISSRLATSSYLETGDPYAYLTGNVGVHGAQLTALGDARVAHLDANITGVPAAVGGRTIETIATHALTADEVARLDLAMLSGRISGFEAASYPKTITVKNADGTQTRIVFTLQSNSNRTASVLTPTP